MTELVIWERAKRAIAEVKTVDEVKAIRDKAEAARVYAKQAGEGLEMQNNIAEVKIRAERRAGELLGEMKKNPGGRPAKNPLHNERGLSLQEMGISHVQSHRWQSIAAVPQEEFDTHIVE